MTKHRTVIAITMGLLLASLAYAQSERQIFHQFQNQTNDLARYQYLIQVMPSLSAQDKQFAQQLLATVDASLGLYDQATQDFPFDNRLPLRIPLPRSNVEPGPEALPAVTNFTGVEVAASADAADTIGLLAKKRRIVMLNEAHHEAQTRALTLELLPLLRADGFNYFAAEALTEEGHQLVARGYPIAASGTVYINEPIYGEILREAIRLGYIIVAYDQSTDTDNRESEQAQTLYEKVFAHDPSARLFVHAGYAHIDKAKGNLFNERPMAMQLMDMAKTNVLSVDQTQFYEDKPQYEDDAYRLLLSQYRPSKAIVLKLGDYGKVWSSDPAKHDVSVILPSNHGGDRPKWLTLNGQRHPWPISSSVCGLVSPCVVEAHYANEPDDAIAADRYTFLASGSSELYLRPGSYRVRAWDVKGTTLYTQTIHVPTD